MQNSKYPGNRVYPKKFIKALGTLLREIIPIQSEKLNW